MSSFSEVVKNRAPAHTFVLPSTAWSHDATERPGGDVAIGLRLISEQDIQNIGKDAAKAAVALYATDDGGTIDEAERVREYNDTLMRGVVGRASCDPNDSDLSFFAHEEDSVRRNLTSDGVKRIFDEYDRFRAETSPTNPAASDEELADLASRLIGGVDLARLPPARKTRMRRMLAHVLEELRALDPDYAPDDHESPVSP